MNAPAFGPSRTNSCLAGKGRGRQCLVSRPIAWGWVWIGFIGAGLAQAPTGPTQNPPALARLAPDTGRLPAERRYLPASINEPLMSMTIQVVQEAPGNCIYRSRHFEFKSPVKLGTGAMKEVCRAFESTHELVSKLPWGILPWPEGGPYFRAELYRTRADYLATGAPQWSAAIYSLRDRIFRIPFEQVGITSRGTDYYLGGKINNDTITHEVTHQMMHEYLRFMPLWMVEGAAEYTCNLPYTSGRYAVSNALEAFKQMRRKAGPTGRQAMRKWLGAEELWGYTTSITRRRPITSLTVDPPQQQSLLAPPAGPSWEETAMLEMPSRYFSSHALVFFFMHFDGDGKGTRLKRYFDAIHEERKLWALYDATADAYETAVKKYEVEWEVFKRNPGVVDLGGGMIRYPSNLKPPAEPERPAGPGGIDPTKVCAKHLSILLGGRSLAQLDQEVRAAFARADSPL